MHPQQMVEIVKALSINARVLIMDEPTSSLSAAESERLFQLIHELKRNGVSIVYISHRLKEVQDLSDRVTVLRDGENAGDLDGDQITHDNLVRLMVGRDISRFYSREPHPRGEVALEVDQLVTTAWPTHAAQFQIHAGEIVGLAGLVGAGRTELLQAIFGIDRPLSGTVRVAGKTTRTESPGDAIQSGVALVPEDRKLQGVILEMSIRHNIGLASLRQHARGGMWLNFSEEKRQSADMSQRLMIKAPSDAAQVGNLSGGNQQKVVLGKWLSLAPRVLMLDEPTRGIDVGAKQEIYHLMDRLAGEGIAILFASGELEEIIGMSDRALVMHEGRIMGELSREELSEEAVMQLATGGAAQQTAGRTE
jgi:ribose transport system ATP-binding protein